MSTQGNVDPIVSEGIRMFDSMVSKYQHNILEATLDWGVVETSYPGCKEKIQKVYPYTRIKFKF